MWKSADTNQRERVGRVRDDTNLLLCEIHSLIIFQGSEGRYPNGKRYFDIRGRADKSGKQ